MLNTRITDTVIGKIYGWDYLSDVDPELLRNNRKAMILILENPSDFPKADFAHADRVVRAIDALFNEHGDLLDQFA